MIAPSRDKPRQRRTNPLWFVVATSIAVILGFMVFWPVTTPHMPNTSAMTRSKLRGLVTAIGFYADDADGRFPPDMSSGPGMYAFIEPYVKNRDVIQSLNPGHPAIIGNGSLAEEEKTRVPDSANTLVFFDSAPWKNEQRRVTSYVDGHAKFVKEVDFQQAIANNFVLAPSP